MYLCCEIIRILGYFSSPVCDVKPSLISEYASHMPTSTENPKSLLVLTSDLNSTCKKTHQLDKNNSICKRQNKFLEPSSYISWQFPAMLEQLKTEEKWLYWPQCQDLCCYLTLDFEKHRPLQICLYVSHLQNIIVNVL